MFRLCFTFSTWKRPLFSDFARNEQQNTILENMYLITYISTVQQNKIHPPSVYLFLNRITFVHLHNFTSSDKFRYLAVPVVQCVALESVHFINSTDAERLCIPEIIEVMFSLPSGWLGSLQDYIKKPPKTTEWISTKHGERPGTGRRKIH